MKIKLLSSAMEDLSRGRAFYERQGEGLDEYFLNFLFSDILDLRRNPRGIRESLSQE